MKPSFDYFQKSWRMEDGYEPALRERASLGDPALIKIKGVDYTIRVGRQGAAVYDGAKLIASMGPLNEFIVLEEYRHRGICTSMIAYWYVKLVMKSTLPVAVDWGKRQIRTQHLQRAFCKAYDALLS